MAKKKTTPTSSSQTKVTRIKASDSPSKKPVEKLAKQKKTASTTDPAGVDPTAKKTPLGAFIGYFKGAWYEIRQVVWPSRSATWKLTVAVLLFAGFFILFSAVLDAFFKYIFELILQ